MQRSRSAAFGRSLVIALTAFFTLVDLFATQAILPSLTKHYGVTPAAMGLAVNSSTFGMAAAGLAMAFYSQRIERRTGIFFSLCLLSIPTTLLAFAPNLAVFAALRVTQGLFMATAFSLTLAYLGERFTDTEAAGAFAAYITGNVASNLVGRFIAAEVVNVAGLSANFFVFAGLNLLGAALVYFTVDKVPRMKPATIVEAPPMAAWLEHCRNPRLRADFGIGFCILFAFIGTFTYVNFVLTRPPLVVGMMELGFIYLVFLPSIITTPLAGPRGEAARHAEDDLGRPCRRRHRLAAPGAAESHGGADGHGAGRRRDVLCAGRGDRLRQPRGDDRSRLGERHLSRLLLHGRTDGQRHPRRRLRSVRLAGVRRRNRSRARRRRRAHAAARAARNGRLTRA